MMMWCQFQLIPRIIKSNIRDAVEVAAVVIIGRGRLQGMEVEAVETAGHQAETIDAEFR